MLPKTGWGNICWVTYSAYVLTMAQKRTQTGRPYRFFRKKKHGRIRGRSQVPGSIGPGDSEKWMF